MKQNDRRSYVDGTLAHFFMRNERVYDFVYKN